MTNEAGHTQGEQMNSLLSYVEEGTGEPLVLIMGLGADREAWRRHVDAWSKHYRCIMIDNRGIGNSPDPDGDHSISLLAADIARLMDFLGLRNVRVAGVSMGSSITQQLMIDRPDLIKKAVLMAPWSRVTPSVASIFESIERAAEHRDTGLLRRLLHLVTWTFAWTDANPDETRRMIEDPAEIPFETIVKQAKACAAFDIVEQSASITTPTLVTLGAQDLIIHPHLSRQTARLISGDLLEYESGHVHHFEEVDQFNKDILEWIK